MRPVSYFASPRHLLIETCARQHCCARRRSNTNQTGMPMPRLGSLLHIMPGLAGSTPHVIQFCTMICIIQVDRNEGAATGYVLCRVVKSRLQRKKWKIRKTLSVQSRCITYLSQRLQVVEAQAYKRSGVASSELGREA